VKKRKKIWRKQKHDGEKEWKYIETKKTLYWILGRTTPVTSQLFTDTIEKITKIFQE